MLISRQATNDYLDRKLDSFLWMKKLTRRELEREIRSFKVRPEFKTEPWLHQLVCFYIGCCMPEFLFLLDMGLGKSKILSDLITQAYRERTLRRGRRQALITVPRIINLGSWRDDLERHSDLEPEVIDVEDIEEKWRRLSNPRGEVTLIDYQSLQWALCRKVKGKGKRNKLEPDPKRVALAQRLYGFVGFDEIHKLANDQSLWFELCQLLSDGADRVYGATGTPFGNDPVEMWAQFKLVDGGETLGENIALFRNAFYASKEDPFAGLKFTYKRKMARELQRMIQHRSIRYDEREVKEVDLPSVVYRKVIMDMTEEQEGHYLDAMEGIINSNLGVEARAANWSTLRRIASGYLAFNSDAGAHLVHFKRNPKLEALERVIDEAGGKKLVVVCEYVPTGQLVHDRLDELGIKHEWLYGGTKDRAGLRERFLHDPKCQVLLMNSEAGGTGTDGLQKVCHYLVFFESPPNPKARKQTEKRIYRPGQLERSFIYDLVARGTVDKRILDRIAEGRDLFEEVVNGGRIQRGLLTS